MKPPRRQGRQVRRKGRNYKDTRTHKDEMDIDGRGERGVLLVHLRPSSLLGVLASWRLRFVPFVPALCALCRSVRSVFEIPCAGLLTGHQARAILGGIEDLW